MNEKKKLNLLPPETKNKYENKYLKITAATVFGFLIMLLSIQYCHMGILNLQTNKILAENQKYNQEKETIKNLKENIANYESFMKDYENDCFPFSLFMYDLEAHRPSDVYIISMDSSERLINEGVQEENTEKNTPKENDKEKIETEKSEDTADESESQTDDKAVTPKIEYIEDLSGREIVIRGFGKNQETISKFIYDITHLPYLTNAEITAIEEHKIENGIYNIFEIKVTGGVYS